MVIGARHHHAIPAGLLQLLAQLEGKIEHDCLLGLAGRCDRAAVEPAMAWVDRHERTNVQALAALVAIGAHERPGGAPRLVVDCKVAQEALAIDGNEIEHEPSWLPLDRIQHERLVDPDRAGSIVHDGPAAPHHQPEAERLYEPAPS